MQHPTAAIEPTLALVEEAPPAATPVPTLWRIYVLVVLTLVMACCITDRQILNIMVEPIRIELGLSDGTMGLLTGIAFALVYTTLCVPMARLADRLPRRWIILAAVSVWSVMTILCGYAQNAWQLFLARFGVGFGEAGGSAPVQAFLSDIFPRSQRATVMAVLLVSSPIGIFGGLAGGGWALQHYGWRTTFLFAGLPGLILAPLVAFTFPKARKGASDGVNADLPPVPFFGTIRMLWSIRTLPFLMFGATLQTIVAAGVGNWTPAFLERSHHLSHQQIGTGLGLAMGLGAAIGSLAGGPLFDALGKRGLHWQARIAMVTSIVAAALAATAFVAPVGYVFPLLGLMMLISGLFAGPLMAMVINLAPVHVRATGLASLFFVLNAVGLGLAPYLIGIGSDLLKPHFGTESLRVALLCATASGPVACYLFYRASLTYGDDIARVDAINRNLMSETA